MFCLFTVLKEKDIQKQKGPKHCNECIEHTLLFDEVTLPLEKESFCGKGLWLEAAGTSADLCEPGRGFPAVSSLSGPVRHQLEFVRPAGGKRVLAQVLQAGGEHPADTSSQVGRVV